MTTFSDIGIPFPLYKAPIETCPNYSGEQYCCLTNKKQEHCFRLGVGGYVKMRCPKCTGELYLQPVADRFRAKTCFHCGAPAPGPIADKDNPFVSYDALRAGQAIFTKDTSYGMISWEQLLSGWTNGVPDGDFSGIKTKTTDDGWTQVKLPSDVIEELTRTPNFSSWQGDIWLFNGVRPLVYAGEWTRQDFISRTPAGISPRDYFISVIDGADSKLWDHVENICCYVFRDPLTGNYAGYFDMD